MESASEDRVIGTASCHCGKVRLEFDAPKDIVVWNCNCSIWEMKRNHHFVLPQSKVKLLDGKINNLHYYIDSEDYLTLYQFNTKVAKHLFCKIWGVQCFYQPRSNPDGYAITIYCVKDYKTLFNSIEWKDYDGVNWEQQIETADIKKYSVA